MTRTAAPPRSEAHAFLGDAWAGKPREAQILIWTGQDKRSRFFGDPEEAADFAVRRAGASS